MLHIIQLHPKFLSDIKDIGFVLNLFKKTKEGVVQRLGYTKNMPQGLLQCFLDLRDIDSV
jgi:hypothetical protein